MPNHILIERLCAARVVPVIRTHSAFHAATAIEWLREAGMRVLATVALIFVALAEPGMAASPPTAPVISPEDAHAGCVHTDLRPCMISLGSAFWFDMTYVTEQIARRNEVDVNGQTAHRRIIFDAKVPRNPAPIDRDRAFRRRQFSLLLADQDTSGRRRHRHCGNGAYR